jgi:hypothetical protein
MTVCRSRGEPGRERHRANSFNGLFGARLPARLFLTRLLQELSLPDRSKAQAHCPALEGSPLDRPLRHE